METKQLTKGMLWVALIWQSAVLFAGATLGLVPIFTSDQKLGWLAYYLASVPPHFIVCVMAYYYLKNFDAARGA